MGFREAVPFPGRPLLFGRVVRPAVACGDRQKGSEWFLKDESASNGIQSVLMIQQMFVIYITA
jgi:hypothetical protein